MYLMVSSVQNVEKPSFLTLFLSIVIFIKAKALNNVTEEPLQGLLLKSHRHSRRLESG